jgi:hypothetical protein
VIDEIISIVERPFGEPSVAHRRRDVVREGEPGGEMFPGLGEERRRMTDARNIGSARRQVQLHASSVAPQQDHADGLAHARAGRAEDRGARGVPVGLHLPAGPRRAQRRMTLFA